MGGSGVGRAVDELLVARVRVQLHHLPLHSLQAELAMRHPDRCLRVSIFPCRGYGVYGSVALRYWQ